MNYIMTSSKSQQIRFQNVEHSFCLSKLKFNSESINHFFASFCQFLSFTKDSHTFFVVTNATRCQPPSGGCELKLIPAYANAVLLPSRLRAAVS